MVVISSRLSGTAFRNARAAGVLAAFMAFGMVPGAAQASDSPPGAASSPAPAPSQWAALVASDQPKTISLDTRTGAVLGVTADSPSAATPQTVVHNPCQTGDACWTNSAYPYAVFGFAGTGTVSGSWTHRSTFYSHSHSSSVCWTYSGTHCSPRVGTNSKITFNVNGFTGIQETNYS